MNGSKMRQIIAFIHPPVPIHLLPVSYMEETDTFI